MTDPVMVAIAAALAGKATQGLLTGARSAWGTLLRLVKDQASDDPVIDAVLTAAQQEPQDQARIDRLGEVLQRRARYDPVFNEQLRSLWEQTRPELHADHEGTVNEISGTVGGHVVQARDIQGGITFGYPS
jgi:hypothetical protein